MKSPVRTIMISLGMLAAALSLSSAALAGDAAKGEKLVAACAACHGSDGNSAVANFPKLAGLGEKYLLKQMQDIKAGERTVPEMTGLLNSFSAEDMADIAAFFNSKTTQLSGSKEQQVQLNSGVKADGLKVGEKTYRAGNMESGVPACTGCHSPRGQGNAPAGFPRLSGQHADYIAKQLRDFRAGNRTNDGEAMVMRGVAKHLSDAEIDALANYIAGLN